MGDRAHIDLRTYLQQVVQLGEAHDLWAADWLRRLTKWFFEFATNVMIVGIFKYVADTSGARLVGCRGSKSNLSPVGRG
jgi:hypothetical protein